jgi:hypothetical protein
MGFVDEAYQVGVVGYDEGVIRWRSTYCGVHFIDLAKRINSPIYESHNIRTNCTLNVFIEVVTFSGVQPY